MVISLSQWAATLFDLSYTVDASRAPGARRAIPIARGSRGISFQGVWNEMIVIFLAFHGIL